jgi:hypothetical protein
MAAWRLPSLEVDDLDGAVDGDQHVRRHVAVDQAEQLATVRIGSRNLRPGCD